MDRQKKDRHMNRHTSRWTDKRKIEIWTGRPIYGQMGKQTNRQMDK